MIKIALVDDNRMTRIGRTDELRYSGKVEVLFIAQNGDDFLEKMKDYSPGNMPEIVIMDIDMPGKNGIETIQLAKPIYPDTEFIMLTVFDEEEKIFDAIKAGASGYILKDESTETILNHLEQVKEFKAVPMSPSVARKALKLLTEGASKTQEVAPQHQLSIREVEVLKCMVNGLNYREIADQLKISPNTVRNQISSIYKKLHVTCKVDAVKVALKNKLT
jgi:DNA-binding NarL/FixJ family response regulator